LFLGMGEWELHAPASLPARKRSPGRVTRRLVRPRTGLEALEKR